MDWPIIRWSSWLELMIFSMMDLWLVVLVSILVFSVFIIAPSGSANSLNLSSKGSTSCSATIALQSSTGNASLPHAWAMLPEQVLSYKSPYYS